jgi:DNA polymerase-1
MMGGQGKRLAADQAQFGTKMTAVEGAMLRDKMIVRKNKLSKEILKVADIHDEWQWKVRNEYVQEFIRMALPCFPRAGDTFNYRIVIDGDAKVGKTWASTH